MANASCNVTALTWHRAITGTLFLLLNNTNYTWDPGVLKIKDTMLDKCALPYQVQFIQHTTELSILISEDWIQYYAPNGIHFVLHGTSFVLLRTTHSSPDNYFRSFHCQAEYCQMRYVWEFSVRPANRLIWNPGVTVLMLSYTATYSILTHFSTSKWKPLWIDGNISMFSNMDYRAAFQQTNQPSAHQSLPMYLNLWESDVYFITYLPP
jgi:hypothetical protein